MNEKELIDEQIVRMTLLRLDIHDVPKIKLDELIGDLQDERIHFGEQMFKAGQESNDCIICNEKDDNMSCQLCIGKQIKKSQQEERERIVKIIKPIIILLNRIEKGNYFDEDDEELMWKKAFNELKSKLEASK